MCKELSDYQKRLVTDNHNLIYFILNKYNLDIDEFYGEAALGLIRSAYNYNSELGKFASYAYKCILNEVYRAIRARVKFQSVNIILNEADRETEGIENIVVSNENTEFNTEYSILIYDRINMLTNTELDILYLKAIGHSNKNIGIQLNMSSTCVGTMLSNIKKILKGDKTKHRVNNLKDKQCRETKLLRVKNALVALGVVV